MNPRAVLKPRRALPFYARHPWVFVGAISAVVGAPADGDAIDLHSNTGDFVARGIWNSKSKIRIRLYSWNSDENLDRDFFHRKLETAVRFRRDTLNLMGAGAACRLVFSESDGLSGLTVDRYDRWLAVQFTALGMASRRDMIVELLKELTGTEGMFLRTERGIGKLEGLELHDQLLAGTLPDGPMTITEDGLQFRVNLCEGQKTGFYLDQRDNRRAAARYAAGRTVLDGFCYTGGFSLHAARAGAAAVDGVDVSESALGLARRNAELNNLASVSFARADVFEHLSALVAQGRRFGMIVLDPPKFARTRSAIPKAIEGYHRLYSLAVRLLNPDGILVGCCCSGLIPMTTLDELVAQVSAGQRRDIQIIERRGQAPDHPVAASCPETSYLKCFICRVM